jgi:hypothetical protein
MSSISKFLTGFDYVPGCSKKKEKNGIVLFENKNFIHISVLLIFLPNLSPIFQFNYFYRYT